MNDKVKDKSIQDLEKRKNKNHLSPVKHPQQDFFIADIFDAISFQTDIASLEYPLFVLKAGDTKDKHFEVNGFKIDIRSTSKGHATIHDKDVWIYCVSKIMQAKREGEETSKVVHFTIYDFLKTTNRAINGTTYERAKDSLDRLKTTNIITEIETDKVREARGFSLIDSWRVVEEKDGRMVRVAVTLPDWLYRSIEAKAVLTISPDYFRLRKPLDRRVYELARKHCGYNKEWTFNLDTLKEKSGSSASLKEFRRSIKSLSISNQLPDYKIVYDEKKDQVTFKNRIRFVEQEKKEETEKLLSNLRSGLGEKDKSKRQKISENEASKLARVGESWEDLLKRIGKDYHVIFNKNK